MKIIIKITLFLLLTSILVSCLKSVEVHDVVQMRATSLQLPADGISKDTFYAYLPAAATAATRFATFTAKTGVFENGKDTMTVPANRSDIKPKNWTATAIFTSSLRAGFDTIYVKASVTSVYRDSVIINQLASVAGTIQLLASSFSVKVNFGSEITLTGKLRNATGNPVSLGTKVKFADFYSDGVTPVNGSFRQLSDTSDINSQVSAIYSPGLATPNTFIYIIATVVDKNGIPQANAPSDKVKIYITP